MKPGLELDVLVATKVLEWDLDAGGEYWYGLYDHQYKCLKIDFKPSSRIRDAWMVVEKLNEMGYDVSVNQYGDGYKPIVTCPKKSDFGFSHKDDTAPMAICLVSLKAVGVEVE